MLLLARFLPQLCWPPNRRYHFGSQTSSTFKCMQTPPNCWLTISFRMPFLLLEAASHDPRLRLLRRFRNQSEENRPCTLHIVEGIPPTWVDSKHQRRAVSQILILKVSNGFRSLLPESRPHTRSTPEFANAKRTLVGVRVPVVDTCLFLTTSTKYVRNCCIYPNLKL